MAGPFKMKGNPMQRNFGIGSSPLEQNIFNKNPNEKTDIADHVIKGFDKAFKTNEENFVKNLSSKNKKGNVKSSGGKVAGVVAGMGNIWGSMPSIIGGSLVRGAKNLLTDVKNIGTGKGRSKKFKKNS